MKTRIAMLVLAMGMCWGLADRATTRALAMPQDDKTQSGDKMKDEKKDEKMEKMKEKRSKLHKIENKNKKEKMEKKQKEEKKEEPKS